MFSIRERGILLLMVSFFIIGACAEQREIPADYHPDSRNWESLISENLSNAEYEPGSWVMEGQTIYPSDHQTLWTQEEYQDFILDLEFRVSEGANSGIFFRTTDPTDVLTALEVQIHDSTDGTPHGQCGAIYDLVSPDTNVTKPAGDWNRLTLTANKNMIYVVMNGTQIIDMDINRWTEPNLNPDGSNNKFDRAIQTQTEAGPIGFQGIHGSAGEPVYYRNLKIRRIN